MTTGAQSASIMGSIGKGFSVASRSLSALGLFFGIYLVNNGVQSYAQRAADSEIVDPAGAELVAQQPGAVVIVLSLLLGVVSFFLWIGLMGALKSGISSGQVSAGNVVGNIGRYWLRLLGVQLLTVVIMVLCVGVAVLPSALVPNVDGVASTITNIWVIIGMVGTFIVAMLLSYSPFVAVADDVKVLAAIRGSMGFVKQRFWRVVGLSLLVGAISVGMLAAAVIPVMLLSAIAAGASAAVDWIAIVLLSAVLAFVLIVVQAALMAFYLGSGTVQTAAPAAGVYQPYNP